MVNSVRHRRSPARSINLLIPMTSPSQESPDENGSGQAKAPEDGYSALFASGLLGQTFADQATSSPTLSAFPSPPKDLRGPFHPSPDRVSDKASPIKSSPESSPHVIQPKPHSPAKTPRARLRSSSIHQTAHSTSPRKIKASGLDGGVERALDNVMRSLKIVAMGTPRRSLRDTVIEESRWSSSSDGSEESSEGGFWRSRKSGESIRPPKSGESLRLRKSEESSRSRTTLRSVKSATTLRSTKSKKSKKGRKSEEDGKMEVDEIPEVPPVPVQPTTPGRSRRMMEGLVKRLGLTPKKKTVPPSGVIGVETKEDRIQLKPGFLGLPEPVERTLPRKSSLSTLRSALSKKTSTGTLRSVRSTQFLSDITNNTATSEAPPPLPPRWRDGEHGDGCVPSTPKGRRTPKSSIGPPRLQKSTSPSTFVNEIPRRAPSTPKKDDDLPPDLPPMPELSSGDLSVDAESVGTPVQLATPNLSSSQEDMDAVEIITFDTPPPLTAKAARRAESPAGVLRPKRLIDLLPRQQRQNLGLQTPPSLKGKKTTVMPGMTSSSALTKLGPLGLPIQGRTPPSASSKSSHSTNTTASSSPFAIPRPTSRDPRGIIQGFETSTPIGGIDRSGAGYDWGTPNISPDTSSDYFSVKSNHASKPSRSTETGHSSSPSLASIVSCPSEAGTFGTFGQTPPLNVSVRSRKPAPDFTASPEKSFDRSHASIRASVESFATMLPGKNQGWKSRYHGGDIDMDAGDSDDDDLPSQEWELEAYLRKLESEDGHRLSDERSVEYHCT